MNSDLALAFYYKLKLLQSQAFQNILLLSVMVNHASPPSIAVRRIGVPK